MPAPPEPVVSVLLVNVESVMMAVPSVISPLSLFSLNTTFSKVVVPGFRIPVPLF